MNSGFTPIHDIDFLLISFSAGKSSVLLDVKPWDDETDMKKLEEAVRSVQMEGLFWGACMLFCLGFLFSSLFINICNLYFVERLHSDLFCRILLNKFQPTLFSNFLKYYLLVFDLEKSFCFLYA